MRQSSSGSTSQHNHNQHYQQHQQQQREHLANGHDDDETDAHEADKENRRRQSDHQSRQQQHQSSKRASMSNSNNNDYDDDDDPEGLQSLEERRQLRAQYRSIITETEEQRQHMMSGDQSVDLTAQLKQVNDLFIRVKTTQDAALDSKALLHLAELSAQKIQRLKLDGGSFDLDDFVSKLADKLSGRAPRAAQPRQYGDDAQDADAEQDAELDAEQDAGGKRRKMDWTLLEPSVIRLSARAPVSGFMYGAIAAEPKQRERVKRTHKLVKDVAKLRKPEELNESDIVQQEHETSTSVQNIYASLVEVEPVSLFAFFVNPQSFSQSVENLFHLSFLVRDGRVSVVDKEGDLMLTTDEPPTEEDAQRGIVNVQQILHLDMDMWEDIIKAYQITDPIIATRQSVAQANDGRWYG
ncbi:Nse4 C-terminal-domain-containing protein [Entophlyctis helioformis]|nr:Nse4 C-terminal-domain-containing protein [Entophlyctis helioformis]